ncbi:MAG: hypothetical protein AAGA66_18910 [Bacteroidota bacterium]
MKKVLFGLIVVFPLALILNLDFSSSLKNNELVCEKVGESDKILGDCFWDDRGIGNDMCIIYCPPLWEPEIVYCR